MIAAAALPKLIAFHDAGSRKATYPDITLSESRQLSPPKMIESADRSSLETRERRNPRSCGIGAGGLGSTADDSGEGGDSVIALTRHFVAVSTA